MFESSDTLNEEFRKKIARNKVMSIQQDEQDDNEQEKNIQIQQSDSRELDKEDLYEQQNKIKEIQEIQQNQQIEQLQKIQQNPNIPKIQKIEDSDRQQQQKSEPQEDNHIKFSEKDESTLLLNMMQKPNLEQFSQDGLIQESLFMSRLFETFFEALPQMILQIANNLLISGNGLQWGWFQYASIATSLISILYTSMELINFLLSKRIRTFISIQNKPEEIKNFMDNQKKKTQVISIGYDNIDLAYKFVHIDNKQFREIQNLKYLNLKLFEQGVNRELTQRIIDKLTNLEYPDSLEFFNIEFKEKYLNLDSKTGYNYCLLKHRFNLLGKQFNDNIDSEIPLIKIFEIKDGEQQVNPYIFYINSEDMLIYLGQKLIEKYENSKIKINVEIVIKNVISIDHQNNKFIGNLIDFCLPQNVIKINLYFQGNMYQGIYQTIIKKSKILMPQIEAVQMFKNHYQALGVKVEDNMEGKLYLSYMQVKAQDNYSMKYILSSDYNIKKNIIYSIQNHLQNFRDENMTVDIFIHYGGDSNEHSSMLKDLIDYQIPNKNKYSVNVRFSNHKEHYDYENLSLYYKYKHQLQCQKIRIVDNLDQQNWWSQILIQGRDNIEQQYLTYLMVPQMEKYLLENFSEHISHFTNFNMKILIFDQLDNEKYQNIITEPVQNLLAVLTQLKINQELKQVEVQFQNQGNQLQTKHQEQFQFYLQFKLNLQLEGIKVIDNLNTNNHIQVSLQNQQGEEQLQYLLSSQWMEEYFIQNLDIQCKRLNHNIINIAIEEQYFDSFFDKFQNINLNSQYLQKIKVNFKNKGTTLDDTMFLKYSQLKISYQKKQIEFQDNIDTSNFPYIEILTQDTQKVIFTFLINSQNTMDYFYENFIQLINRLQKITMRISISDRSEQQQEIQINDSFMSKFIEYDFQKLKYINNIDLYFKIQGNDFEDSFIQKIKELENKYAGLQITNNLRFEFPVLQVKYIESQLLESHTIYNQDRDSLIQSVFSKLQNQEQNVEIKIFLQENKNYQHILESSIQCFKILINNFNYSQYNCIQLFEFEFNYDKNQGLSKELSNLFNQTRIKIYKELQFNVNVISNLQYRQENRQFIEFKKLENDGDDCQLIFQVYDEDCYDQAQEFIDLLLSCKQNYSMIVQSCNDLVQSQQVLNFIVNYFKEGGDWHCIKNVQWEFVNKDIFESDFYSNYLDFRLSFYLKKIYVRDNICLKEAFNNSDQYSQIKDTTMIEYEKEDTKYIFKTKQNYEKFKNILQWHFNIKQNINIYISSENKYFQKIFQLFESYGSNSCQQFNFNYCDKGKNIDVKDLQLYSNLKLVAQQKKIQVKDNLDNELYIQDQNNSMSQIIIFKKKDNQRDEKYLIPTLNNQSIKNLMELNTQEFPNYLSIYIHFRNIQRQNNMFIKNLIEYFQDKIENSKKENFENISLTFEFKFNTQSIQADREQMDYYIQFKLLFFKHYNYSQIKFIDNLQTNDNFAFVEFKKQDNTQIENYIIPQNCDQNTIEEIFRINLKENCICNVKLTEENCNNNLILKSIDLTTSNLIIKDIKLFQVKFLENKNIDQEIQNQIDKIKLNFKQQKYSNKLSIIY